MAKSKLEWVNGTSCQDQTYGQRSFWLLNDNFYAYAKTVAFCSILTGHLAEETIYELECIDVHRSKELLG